MKKLIEELTKNLIGWQNSGKTEWRGIETDYSLTVTEEEVNLNSISYNYLLLYLQLLLYLHI